MGNRKAVVRNANVGFSGGGRKCGLLSSGSGVLTILDGLAAAIGKRL